MTNDELAGLLEELAAHATWDNTWDGMGSCCLTHRRAFNSAVADNHCPDCPVPRAMEAAGRLRALDAMGWQGDPDELPHAPREGMVEREVEVLRPDGTTHTARLELTPEEAARLKGGGDDPTA